MFMRVIYFITLLFDRFLIMYNLCVFTYIIFIFCISLYTCANVICIKLLLTYLLTYRYLLNTALFYDSLLFLVNYPSHLMLSATFCLQKF